MNTKIIAISASLATLGAFVIYGQSLGSDEQTVQVATQAKEESRAAGGSVVPVYLKRNEARYANSQAVDPSLESAEQQKRQALIKECMSEKGVPLPTQPAQSTAPAPVNNEILGGKLDSNGVPATRRVYVNPELAASQGYSLSPEEIAEERDRRKALDASATDGDQDHSGMDLSQAQRSALYGTGEGTVRKALSSGLTVAVSPDSCTARADAALFGDSAHFASVEMKYVNRASLSLASLRDDPAYAKALKTYRKCMAASGFREVRSPGFGVHRALSMRIERGDAALPDERKLAQADVTCEASAKFYESKRSAEDRMLNARSSLDEGRAAVADYESMLRKAISK